MSEKKKELEKKIEPCNHPACKEMLTLWAEGACGLRMRAYRRKIEREQKKKDKEETELIKKKIADKGFDTSRINVSVGY